MSSGNLNGARYLFRKGAYVSFLAGSLLLLRRTFDVNSAEIVVQKLSSMLPSTALGLVTAGASRAPFQGVAIDESESSLSPSRFRRQAAGLFAGVRAPGPVGYGPGVPSHDGLKYGDG